MQTTTYTWITNCQKENANISVMISPVGLFLLLRLIYTGAQQNMLAHSLGLFYFSKVMQSFVLLCVSQLFSACTVDVVFTLGHADAQPCTMYNCFFVRLAATIMHVPLKYCLHDLHGKELEVNFVRSFEKHLVRVSATACCEVTVLRRYSRWVYCILRWLL